MKKEKSCGAIILKKEDNIYKALIVKQSNGYWSFPKGHVEEKETEKETAIREIKEETSLDAEIITGFRFVVNYVTDKNVLKEVVLFLAKPLSFDITLDNYETIEYKWATFEELYDMFASFELVKAIDEAYNYITNNEIMI